MANEFYVAEDGSIHRQPVTEYRPLHQISEGRIVWFWIISIIMALLIAVGVNQGFGVEVYGSDGGFIATIGPFVVFAGALAGSILYGTFCAKSVDYNLWAYVLSALSSIGGIVATEIAVAIICFVVMILFYILIIGTVMAIVCGILGGS